MRCVAFMGVLRSFDETYFTINNFIEKKYTANITDGHCKSHW